MILNINFEVRYTIKQLKSNKSKSPFIYHSDKNNYQNTSDQFFIRYTEFSDFLIVVKEGQTKKGVETFLLL
jgi:hypothetical protein